MKLMKLVVATAIVLTLWTTAAAQDFGGGDWVNRSDPTKDASIGIDRESPLGGKYRNAVIAFVVALAMLPLVRRSLSKVAPPARGPIGMISLLAGAFFGQVVPLPISRRVKKR